MVLQNSSLEKFRQRNEWSCGVYAVRYLLSLKGWKHLPNERDLRTSKEHGTSPGEIIKYLKSHGIPCVLLNPKRIHDLEPPFLVNFQWGNDGHFGVVVKNERAIHVFNPWNAKIDRYSNTEFEKRWYSLRNGRHVAIAVEER